MNEDSVTKRVHMYVIKDMYEGANIRVKRLCGETLCVGKKVEKSVRYFV